LGGKRGGRGERGKEGKGKEERGRREREGTSKGWFTTSHPMLEILKNTLAYIKLSVVTIRKSSAMHGL